jgi:hypothetical protein
MNRKMMTKIKHSVIGCYSLDVLLLEIFEDVAVGVENSEVIDDGALLADGGDGFAVEPAGEVGH